MTWLCYQANDDKFVDRPNRLHTLLWIAFICTGLIHPLTSPKLVLGQRGSCFGRDELGKPGRCVQSWRNNECAWWQNQLDSHVLLWLLHLALNSIENVRLSRLDSQRDGMSLDQYTAMLMRLLAKAALFGKESSRTPSSNTSQSQLICCLFSTLSIGGATLHNIKRSISITTDRDAIVLVVPPFNLCFVYNLTLLRCDSVTGLASFDHQNWSLACIAYPRSNICEKCFPKWCHITDASQRVTLLG